jgi:hypothetical protein
MAREAVWPLTSVPCRSGLDPGTGDAILTARSARRKGGDKGAREEEGREEDLQEEVTGSRGQAREQAPSPDAFQVSADALSWAKACLACFAHLGSTVKSEGRPSF